MSSTAPAAAQTDRPVGTCDARRVVHLSDRALDDVGSQPSHWSIGVLTTGLQAILDDCAAVAGGHPFGDAAGRCDPDHVLYLAKAGLDADNPQIRSGDLRYALVLAALTEIRAQCAPAAHR